MQLKHRTFSQIIPVAVAATANIGLNLWLIPIYGLEGAAVSTVAAYVLSVIVGWLLVHFQIQALPFPTKDFVKVISATALMALVLWPLREEQGLLMLLVQVGLGTVVYLGGAWMMNLLGIRKIVLRKKSWGERGFVMISIIIPTLGTREAELRRLFQSMEEQTEQRFEAVVVSQANHETVARLLEGVSFCYQHIRLERRGLSHARNIGATYINGELVTFSDDDCWYEPDAFAEAWQFFRSNPKTGLVCFQIFDPVSEQFYKRYPPFFSKTAQTKRAV